jgi:putative glutamine amidotransferase
VTRKPLVAVPACNYLPGEAPSHSALQQYVQAVRLAGALPLIVPPMPADEIDTLLDAVDGVLLSGSPSNVHPSHFGEPVANPALPLDPARDAWVLPLVPRVLARGIPLLAICRGAQEVNVALGGSLHQAVHAVGPYRDHRADAADPQDVQWGPAHPVRLAPGGLLQTLTGRDGFEVNSLHGQAVARLAPGLSAEAWAPDGLVEAFRQPDAAGFNLCVQWHPEWRAEDNPVSMAVLRAFGEACMQARAARTATAG